MDACAGAIELHGELEPVDSDGHDERAGAARLHRHALERLAFERLERRGHLARTVGKLAAAGQTPVGLQRGLLTLGAVHRADAAGGEAELDQRFERLRLVLAELALLDGSDEVGEPAATLPVVHVGEHRLRLAERDLGRFSGQRDHACFPTVACSSCSNPPCSIEQCMPHSFGAFFSHHQRPARSSSPASVARVHGAQPIEVNPRAYSGWIGTSFSRRYVHTSRPLHSARGLIFTIAPWSWSISTLRMFVRVAHWSRRRPVIHASSPSRCFVSGMTLRTLQHRSRFSTESRNRSGPFSCTRRSTCSGSGWRISNCRPG